MLPSESVLTHGRLWQRVVGEDDCEIDVAGAKPPRRVIGFNVFEADVDALMLLMESGYGGRHERGARRDECAEAERPAEPQPAVGPLLRTPRTAQNQIYSGLSLRDG